MRIMRAVYWKELRELSLVGIPLTIAAAFVGWEYALYSRELPFLAILGGVIAGVAQGILDRKRRDDLFLRHRPLSRGRLDAARTAAGLTVLLVAAAALITFLAWGMHDFAVRMRAFPTHRPADDPELTPGLVAYVFVLPLAAWAGLRWVFSARRLWQVALLLLVVPLLFSIQVGRTGSVTAAAGVALLIAIACTWHVVAPRRALVTLLLAGWLGLELAADLREGAHHHQFDAYPAFGLTVEGKVKSWIRDPDVGEGIREYDLERNLVERHNAPWAVRGLTIGFSPRPDETSRYLPGTTVSNGTAWPRWLAESLNDAQAWDAATHKPRPQAPLEWRFESGRFVCRERGSGAVAAGFGPDGYATGPGATSGARFEGELRYNANAQLLDDLGQRVSLARPDGQGAYQLVFSARGEHRPDEPLRVDVGNGLVLASG